MIPLFDLTRQNQTIKREIMSSIEQIIDDSDFCNGKPVQMLENEISKYLESKYAAGVSSGSSALILALKALGIKEDDEVIVPANTFIATIFAVVHLKATPVFVDCDVQTGNMDINQIENKITPKTRCVIVVHMYGVPAEVVQIQSICKKHNLELIEDCAQAFGSKYENRYVGTFGRFGCFSFYPSKNIGGYGESGMLLSDSESDDLLIKCLRNHGSTVRYHHDFLGYNMKMDSMQAAVLLVKMKYVTDWIKRRIEICSKYRREINNPNITNFKVPQNSMVVNYLYVVLVDNQMDFIQYLENNGIGSGIYYPIMCPAQKALNYLNVNIEDYPNANYISKHIVALPLFPELTDIEVNKVIQVVNQYTIKN